MARFTTSSHNGRLVNLADHGNTERVFCKICNRIPLAQLMHCLLKWIWHFGITNVTVIEVQYLLVMSEVAQFEVQLCRLEKLVQLREGNYLKIGSLLYANLPQHLAGLS